MNCVYASDLDVPLLAQLNRTLIVEEKHRNRMTLAELEDRMRGWLAHGEYQAVLFKQDEEVAGYALFRREGSDIYLRQFLICSSFRRRGIGRAAFLWLRENPWKDAPRVRLDVLVGNADAIAFYHAIGFSDYCLTLELDQGSTPTTL